MISGANDKDLVIAEARADIMLKLDNTSTYESWLIIDTYIEQLEKALIDIRDKIKDKGQRHQMAVLEQMDVEDFCLDGYECSDILQIIDKVLGGSDE